MIRPFTIPRVVLLIASGALGCIGQAPTGLTSLPSSAYEHVYRHVLHLQALDANNTAAGKHSNFSAYYKNLANLTQAQADAMALLSQAAVTALNALDQQAQTVIRQWRAQRPSTLLPGQKPPAPPGQLVALQASRKAVLDSYRGKLVQTLGQSSFNTLEQALIRTYNVGPQQNGQTGH